jgi:hypothetical protein
MSSPLKYARAGVPIFPVQVYRDGDRWRKRPHVEKWALLATTSTKQIEAWWAKWPLALVGVPLERVGLVVVDCDRHGNGQDGVAALAAIDLPPHQAVVTISNGEHHFLRQPAPRIRWLRWAGGEILGDGRFVVGYAVEPFVAACPVLSSDLLGRLPGLREGGTQKHTMRPSISKPRPDPTPTQSVALRSKYLLRKVEQATPPSNGQPGERNATLHWASCRHGNMIGEGSFKSREVAEHLLIEAAKVCGIWQDDGEEQCLATIRSGIETGIKEWHDFEIRGRIGVCGNGGNEC